MMTPSGARHTDPMFEDYPTFIRDLAGWLGLDVTSTPGLESTEAIARLALRNSRDRRGFSFLSITLKPLEISSCLTFLTTNFQILSP